MRTPPYQTARLSKAKHLWTHVERGFLLVHAQAIGNKSRQKVCDTHCPAGRVEMAPWGMHGANPTNPDSAELWVLECAPFTCTGYSFQLALLNHLNPRSVSRTYRKSNR